MTSAQKCSEMKLAASGNLNKLNIVLIVPCERIDLKRGAQL